jgi:hypothetical protein
MHLDHLLEKGVGKMNEDAIFLGGNRFGVFDGASSLDGYVDEEGRTGGYLAANIVRDTFEKSNGLLRETALTANRKIAEAMAAKGIDINRKENSWCSTLAVVEIDLAKKEFELVQIADSLIVVIGKDGAARALVQDYDHDQSVMAQWKELADNHTDDIRSKLQDRMVELRRTANVAYGVLNGDLNAENFLRTGRESLESARNILLFSDGLTIPKKDPRADDDLSLIAELFLAGGLKRIRDYIREIEESDPNCWKYPRYKKSDDIAAIAISF